jgi:hypothetical protein
MIKINGMQDGSMKKYENDNQTAGIVFHKSKSKQPTT